MKLYKKILIFIGAILAPVSVFIPIAVMILKIEVNFIITVCYIPVVAFLTIHLPAYIEKLKKSNIESVKLFARKADKAIGITFFSLIVLTISLVVLAYFAIIFK